ncbi:MAG: tetratricopeptide repeat protein [Planctomycetes bacterium]|nr:tetratricopeptide repeat protein [Planctomycetota bacterium]
MLRTLVLCLVAVLAPAQTDADEQYAFVARLAEQKLFDQVVVEAERFLAEHPRHAKANAARYRLACARFELDDVRAARADFAALAEVRGFEFEGEVLFRLGQCALDEHDCAAAVKALDRAVEVARDYLKTPARWLLGEACFACEDYARADLAYRAVLAVTPAGEYTDDALAGATWCAYRTKRFDEAERLAARYRAEFPRGERAAELQYLRGEALLELGRPREALECFAAVREGELADGALRGAGFAQSALGDHVRAAQCFARVVEVFPQSRHAAECALQAGVEWLAAGRPADAVRALSAPAAGESFDVFVWRARASAGANDHAAALTALERAAKLAPDDAAKARVASARADSLAALGRKDEALAEYRRAGDDYALAAAAVAHWNERRYSDAAAAARALLEKFPKSEHAGDAWLVLGECELAEGRHAEAERAFVSAALAASAPAKRTHAASRRAWCRYLAGDPHGAAPLFAELSAANGEAAEIDEAGFMAARSLEAAGDASAARAGYERYLAERPRGAKVDEATLRVALLDGSEAEATLARLEGLVRTAREPEIAARARFELAERLSRAGRAADASEHYRALLASDTNASLAPAARYGLAWCLQAQGDVAGASELLSKLLALPELDARLRSSAGELAVWCAAKRNDPDALLGAWRSFASGGPEESRLVAIARTALDALRKASRVDDVERVLAEVEPRLTSDAARATLAVERVYARLDARDPDGAEAALDAAVRLAPRDPAVAEAAFFVGEARWAAGAKDRALALYERAAQVPANPAFDRALYKLGFAKLERQDVPGAERAFATLLESAPKSGLVAETRFLLGEARFRRKAWADACAALEPVVRETPKHEVVPKALYRLGLARVELGEWQAAADALGELAKRAPDFPHLAEAELARGKALAALGRVRDARAALARTIALDQGLFSARAHLVLGEIALAAGEHETALSEFLKVAVLYDAPDENARGLLLAGRTLEARGDVTRAAERYREVVEKFATSPSAAEARERLRAAGSAGSKGPNGSK